MVILTTYSTTFANTQLNRLKIRTPANDSQVELEEGRCTYIPSPVKGDLIVVFPRKSKGFSFCAANAYCKFNGEIIYQRLFCNTVDKKCPKDPNICANDKFGDYVDSN